MKQVGYINISQYNEHFDYFATNMKRQENPVICIESGEEPGRPKWRKFVNELEEGDVAILQSFANAFGNFNELVFFLKYCVRKNIRIISLEDNIDSSGILFEESNVLSVFNAIIKIASYHPNNSTLSFDPEFALPSKRFDKVLKQHRTVINMYNAGFRIKDILEKTGYKTKTTIYRILQIYEIEKAYPSKIRIKNQPTKKNI